MSDQKIIDDVMPTAAPSEAELRRWRHLPADEQKRRLSAAIEAGFAAEPSNQSIEDIIQAGQQRARDLSHG